MNGRNALDSKLEDTLKALPRVGIGVIVKKNSKVLLGLRKNSHGNGTWAFPGGHFEFGESFANTAIREVKEETGLIICSPCFVNATNDFFADEGKHYVTLFLEADYKDGQLALLEPHKCLKWEWFKWDELPTPLFLTIKNFLDTGYRPIFTDQLIDDTYRIRRARGDDLASIVALLLDDELGKVRETLDLIKYQQAFSRIICDPQNIIMVVEGDGVIAGTLQFTIIDNLTFSGSRRALLEGVRISSKLRGRGIGSKFIRKVIEIAKEANCKMIQLTTNNQRGKTLDFYRSLGFEDTHTGFKLYL